jgi:predicted nucleic acid-binding Zn ribbon protein
VGAGLGVAATLGWVAAGTSNAHADADEAEVISNWSNTHQCKPQVRSAAHTSTTYQEGGSVLCMRAHLYAC